MNKIKEIGYGVVGVMFTGTSFAANVPADSASALNNLATIWNDIVGKFTWLIWGIAILWALYDFSFGNKKDAWRPLAGAAFLYIVGVILTLAGGIDSAATV